MQIWPLSFMDVCLPFGREAFRRVNMFWRMGRGLTSNAYEKKVVDAGEVAICTVFLCQQEDLQAQRKKNDIRLTRVIFSACSTTMRHRGSALLPLSLYASFIRHCLADTHQVYLLLFVLLALLQLVVAPTIIIKMFSWSENNTPSEWQCSDRNRKPKLELDTPIETHTPHQHNKTT